MSLDYEHLRPLADDLQRIEPAAPPQAFRTFGVAAPLSTHFVPATCAEVNCPDYLQGFRCHVEAIGPRLAHAARTSGRKYAEVSYGPGQTWLEFEPGQPCFRASEHRRRLEREEIWYMHGGDHRARGQVVTVSGSSWNDEFGEHQERIAGQAERG